MQLKKKIAAALVGGSILGATLLPTAALADTSCEISGNGAHSHNTCRITKRKTVRITQSNSSRIKNVVVVVAGTGNNDANNNTGGDVTVDSGDVTVKVKITNEVNQNN